MNRTARLCALVAAALIILLPLGVVAGRLALYSWLRSPGFLEMLNAATASTLRVEGGFAPLKFEGSTAYSGSFAATGKPGTIFQSIQADQLRAGFEWRGLLHKRWRIEELTVQRMNLRIGEAPAAAPTDRPRQEERAATRREPARKDWKLDLRKAVVQHATLAWGGDAGSPAAGSLADSAVTVAPEGAGWSIQARGGTLAQTGWPELKLDVARFRWQEPVLFLTQCTLLRDEGRISITGEVHPGEEAALLVEVTRMDVAPLLAPDWRMRLFGNATGEVKIRFGLGSRRSGSFDAQGSLHLTEARLEALPILNQIAAFTRTERFRHLPLTSASIDFERSGSRFVARNVIMESAGLMRVEGGFAVEHGTIGGTLQVGVSPSVLQWLPGSQERVFTVPRNGYVWTPVRLSGPVGHPSEDLTGRLVAAAGGALMDEAGDAGRKAEETAREAARSLLDMLLR
jgi:hypothetical protein